MGKSLQAKSGNAQDIGKNDPLAGLPNPGQALDAVKGLAGDAKQGGKNVASDLSDLPNPFDGAGTGAGSIADKVCIAFYVASLILPGAFLNLMRTSSPFEQHQNVGFAAWSLAPQLVHPTAKSVLSSSAKERVQCCAQPRLHMGSPRSMILICGL